jgi:CheY-like chemotaxis protein
MAETDPYQPCVLLLEDQWLIALDLQGRLEDAGYHVVGPASTVEKALRLVGRHRIDVGVLDVNLGEETAYPVGTALRNHGIPFVFLSGHAREDLQPEFRDFPLLSKPVSHNALLEMLGRLVDRSSVSAKPAEQ